MLFEEGLGMFRTFGAECRLVAVHSNYSMELEGLKNRILLGCISTYRAGNIVTAPLVLFTPTYANPLVY